MKAIITGDIINSRKVDPQLWINDLKKVLNNFGKEPIDWEIFRGDSFQIITEPNLALEIALIIKANIKKNKNLDVRLAIGIGDINYKGNKITESNGSAFIYSGECFENLKKSTLGIKTSWPNFDKNFNTIFKILSLYTNNWSSITAEIIEVALENKNLNQQQLAKKLNRKSQSTISATLKRGAYDEIIQVLDLYTYELDKLC